MAICDPDDEEHAAVVADYLIEIIIAQAGEGTSGASSWIEELF